MLPAIIGGGIASFFLSRFLTAGEDAQRAARSPVRYGPNGQAIPVPPPVLQPLQPEAHMEPRTRAGLERLLIGGTPEQLEQAGMELLRAGYPIAAQICVMQGGARRRVEEDRKLLAQRQAEAHAAAKQREAEAKAIAEGGVRLQAIAEGQPASPEAPPQLAVNMAPAPVVVVAPPPPAPAAVPVASPPAPGLTAPPATSGPEGVTPQAKRSRAPRAKAKPPVVVPAHANGRAVPEA